MAYGFYIVYIGFYRSSARDVATGDMIWFFSSFQAPLNDTSLIYLSSNTPVLSYLSMQCKGTYTIKGIKILLYNTDNIFSLFHDASAIRFIWSKVK